MSDAPLCPECHGPVNGLGPVVGRRWGKKPAEPSNGYCTACHIGLTKTGHHWVRSAR
jgi:hypothetical protein